MPIIKTALTGDMHVNVPRRSEEAFRIAYWMGEDWKSRGVHLIGIGGDLVDGPMTERERAKLIDLITFYSTIAPVVIADGNHEVELALRNALGKIPNVIVEDGAGLHMVSTPYGRIVVACVSFPKKAALLAAVGRPVSGEEADQIAGQALQDVFRGIGLQYQQRFTVEPLVALVHGTIKGSKVQPGDQPDRPLGLDIALSDIALMNADFVCAPHVHLAQEWPIPNGNAICATPSSPFYADYGEAKHFKGYIIAEFDTDIVKVTPGDCAAWFRVPTPATPMLLVEAKLADALAPSEMKTLNSVTDQKDIGLMLNPPSALAGADVRLRYHFSADQRVAAKNTAELWAELAVHVSGAAKVALDPVQTPTTRSRIPALATTVRLEDKLKLYWKAIGFEVSPEREAILLEMLHELQEAAAAQGLSMGTAGRAAPSLEKVSLKGFLKYPERVDLDFTTMAGPLTAIIAPNEEGKSLLMNLIGPGLMYGNTTNRGTLNDLSTAKDSYVSGQFVMDGARYALTQSVNGMARTGTVSLVKDGKPELGNKSAGGRDDYKKWAAKNLLPWSVYIALLCQSGDEDDGGRKTNIIDMKDGERTEQLLRILGLEIYEALAEMARKAATSVSTELEGVRSRILEIGNTDIDFCRQHPEDLRVEFQNKQGLLALAEASLEDNRKRAGRVEQLLTERASLVARRAELAGQVIALREKRTQIQTRIDVGKEVTGQKESIESAVVQVAELELKIAAAAGPVNDIDRRVGDASSAHGRLQAELRGLGKRVDEGVAQDRELRTRLAEIETKIADARAVVADAEQIRAAIAETMDLQQKAKAKWDDASAQRVREAELAGELRDLQARTQRNIERRDELMQSRNIAQVSIEAKPEVEESVALVASLTRDIATTTGEQEAYKAEVEHLTVLWTSAATTENKALRTGHEEIISGADPVPRACRAIEEADDAAEEGLDAPTRLVEVKERLAGCEGALKQCQRSLAGHQANAARLPQIEVAEKNFAEAATGLEEIARLDNVITEEGRQRNARQEALASEVAQTQSDIRWLEDQIFQLEPLVARGEMLATAETKIEGLLQQARVLDQDRGRLTTAGASLLIEIGKLEDEAKENKAVLSHLTAKKTAIIAEIAALDAQIEALKPVASKAPMLAVALAAAEELLNHLAGVDVELHMLESGHARVSREVDDFTPPDPVDVPSFEKDVADARAALTEIQTRLALAEKELADAVARERRRQDLQLLVRGLEEKVSNWTALAQHLGKDGLQKEEVSCAGPQLTEITNNLLRAAGDTRHTVSIETERLHSNKKQMIPCLDIMVFDSVEQLSKESRRLSGAGKILVGEPFSLALVTLGCQRAGISRPTIFRDEATGVMDVTNSGFYIGMLRGFADILDAHVVFISQNPAMWDLADSTIEISNGKVVVA